MHKELARRFGNVEVVLEEALNGHERFAIEQLKASLLEDLLQEHLAKSSRKLIYQTSDTEIVVAYYILFGFEHSADLNGDLSFLVSSGKVLDVINYRRDTDRDL